MNEFTQPATPPLESLYGDIRRILDDACGHVRQTINDTMVQAYWHIGRLIVDEVQICYALRSYLTWTHYRQLILIDDPAARRWYFDF